MRWSALGPEEYLRQRAVLADLLALDAHLRAGAGHRPAKVAQLVAFHRKADLDEPPWRGVEPVEQTPAGVHVRFAAHADPLLRPVGTAGGRVSCHLDRRGDSGVGAAGGS